MKLLKLIPMVLLLFLLSLPTPTFSGPFDETEVRTNAPETAAVEVSSLFRPPPATSSSLLFRVAGYNIAHARGNRQGGIHELARMKNLRGIAGLLKKNRVDIIGFTEISKGDMRAGFHNQPKYLAEQLLANYVYAENVNKGWFGILATQGNAIVSRYPILSSKNHLLYRSDEKHEQRSCLEGLIDLGNGKKLRIFVAHLSTKHEESAKQVEEIHGWINESKEPAILLGDFNLRPGSDPIKWLSRRMKDTTANLKTTYLNKDGVKIDYHFITGEITSGKASVLGFKEGYSDHGCVVNDYLIRLVP